MLARLAPIALPKGGIYKKNKEKNIKENTLSIKFCFLIGHALIGQDKMQVLRNKVRKTTTSVAIIPSPKFLSEDL